MIPTNLLIITMIPTNLFIYLFIFCPFVKTKNKCKIFRKFLQIFCSQQVALYFKGMSNLTLMYKGPSVNVTDAPCVQRCALSMCCTFSNHFFELNLGLHSLHLRNNTKETFSSTLKLFNNAFCPLSIYVSNVYWSFYYLLISW